MLKKKPKSGNFHFFIIFTTFATTCKILQLAKFDKGGVIRLRRTSHLRTSHVADIRTCTNRWKRKTFFVIQNSIRPKIRHKHEISFSPTCSTTEVLSPSKYFQYRNSARQCLPENHFRIFSTFSPFFQRKIFRIFQVGPELAENNFIFPPSEKCRRWKIQNLVFKKLITTWKFPLNFQ